MKKAFHWLLVACMLAALLPTGVLAAEAKPTDAGVYGVTNTTLTLTPQKADKTVIDKGSQGGHDDYYADAVRFGVSASDLTAGAQYLLLVVKETASAASAASTTPTADNIVYIDQAAADDSGAVTFNAYPSALTTGHYCVYLVGTGKTYVAASPAAAFDYYQPYTLGDVNDDGKILSSDALFALQMSVGLGTWTDTQRLAADVDKSETILSNDALYILQKSVGLPTVF